MFSRIRWIFPVILIITFICSIVYVVMQQNYRLSANDPQIQMAESFARDISEHGGKGRYLSRHKTDISTSLETFVIIFNLDKQPLESSALLHESIPIPPAGVFDHAALQRQHRVTWQPERGVRIAAVVVKTEYGYVLVGRSLREVEMRITVLGLTLFLIWFISVGVTFICFLLWGWWTTRHAPKRRFTFFSLI